MIASPRNRSVTTLASPESPNSSSKFIQGLGDRVSAGQRGCCFQGWRPPGDPGSQQNGNDDKNKNGDVGPDRNQPAQPPEKPAHAILLHTADRSDGGSKGQSCPEQARTSLLSLRA